MNNKIIECYDIGGTNIRGACLKNGEIISELITVSSVKNNIQELINKIKFISKKIRDSVSPDAVSIGLPGPIANGILECSPPLRINSPVDLQKQFINIFNEPLFFENDMTMAVHAEYYKGQGKNYDNFTLITLSTGLGVGVVINNNILTNNIEVGHSVICGDLGSQTANIKWIDYSSGMGIQKLLKKNCIRENIIEFFKSDNHPLFDIIKEANVRGFSNIVNAYAPEAIVIMGSIGLNQFNKIIPNSTDLKKYTIAKKPPVILKTDFDDKIGIIGCYYNAIINFGKEK